MPTYAFRCRSCAHAYEDFLPLAAELPTRCPACGGDSFGQDYRQCRVVGLVRGNPTTVGQAAEANERREGAERTRAILGEAGRRSSAFTGRLPAGATPNRTGTGATPPWRDGSFGLPPLGRPLDLGKVKDFRQYVATGETG